MIVSLIAAHDPDLVIGHKGRLPWHIPEDMAHFKQRTMGHPVVMGRGVFEELGCRALPGRRNLVLTRTANYDNAEVCRSHEQALALLSEEKKIYIIGGEQIYRLFMPLCQRLEISLIHKRYKGDTWFPEYRNHIGSVWREVWAQKNPDVTFVDYERIEASP